MSKSESMKLPPNGTIVRAIEFAPSEEDLKNPDIEPFEGTPRVLIGPIEVFHVERWDYDQVLVNGIPVDPETVEVVTTP